ncbi:aquaporin Z [Microbacterium sp. LMI1-1-1.1]|uniref:aquaporin Z n=1 Tax=Microbacterium sp. LMI1-1-1.1 TaxID=3135223 RepID=UPI0034676FD7
MGKKKHAKQEQEPVAVADSTVEQRKQNASEWSSLARYGAEAFGTFLLVLGGVGTAVFAANFPAADDNQAGVGFLGVALAFGLTLVAGIAAVGHISGGHFNPAVTLGLLAAGRTDARHVPGYILAQLVGGIAASSVIALILTGKDGGFAAAQDAGFASNGFGEGSPGGFGLAAVFIAEAVLTGIFVAVILSITAKKEYVTFAPIGIGLTLTLIHLISIPISNTSVNPARSVASAVYGGALPVSQLWVFIVAPILGAAVAGLIVRALGRRTVAV